MIGVFSEDGMIFKLALFDGKESLDEGHGFSRPVF
jgi:hypothetical protein